MSFHRIILGALFTIILTFYSTGIVRVQACLLEGGGGNKTQIVALILARGGSKGIPLKNLAKIGDESLLGRSLRIILNCSGFDDLWVSTDHQGIADEATRYGANVHWRHESTARDNSTSLEAVQEFLKGHPHIQNVALIQCTSVFIREKYLEKAIELFHHEKGIDCIFAVVRSWKLRWRQTSETQLKAINFDMRNRPRRQDWEGELIETGTFYFARRRLIERENAFQNDRCRYVEIDAKDALEIDDSHQLQLANILLRMEQEANGKVN